MHFKMGVISAVSPRMVLSANTELPLLLCVFLPSASPHTKEKKRKKKRLWIHVSLSTQ